MAEQIESEQGKGRAKASSSQPAAVALTPIAVSPDQRDAPIEQRGTTTIADSVVHKVAGIAAREVPGVYQLGGAGARAFSNVTQRVGIGDLGAQGVSVEVGVRQAAVDLTLVVEYGESIPQITQRVRNQVIKRVESITGLEVTEVNIMVDDLHFAGDEELEGQASRVS
ncbi:MAG: Asp23/Gls24 family envelope stress response protein [Solirubrobacteraceae bacterium]